MAADVMQKAKASADFKNGSTVTGVDKQGNKHTLSPDVNRVTDDTALFNKYNTRFTDTTYYTA